MKPLYETGTVITLEEFRKYNRVRANRRATFLVLLVFELLMLAMLIYSFRQGDRTGKQLYIIMLILIPVISYFIPRYMEKRMYLANETAHNMATKTLFYKDYFEQQNRLGSSTKRYDELMRIIETETNFYLLLNKQQGAIIIKQNCPPGLIEFIRKQMQILR